LGGGGGEQGQPAVPWTATTWLQEKVKGMIHQHMVGRFRQSEITAACVRYAALTDTQKTTIKTLLGGKEPCL